MTKHRSLAEPLQKARQAIAESERKAEEERKRQAERYPWTR